MGKLSVLGLVLLLAACDSQKEPAQAAFAQLQSAVAPVSADLEKYAPAEFVQLTQQIDALKAKLNAKDYAGVLAAKTQVMAQLVAASSAAGKHKNELAHQLTSEWKSFSASVPALLGQLGTRISNLESGKSLPVGLSATVLQQAKQSLADLNAQWNAALDAIQRRDLDQAVTKAREIQKQAGQIGAQLGMKLAG